ncbi:MAG: flavodoxin [Chloroflexi bacterium]|nr:flavodoxin [Chloroflexota bacterium]
MTNTILVTAASRRGTTLEVAQMIADELRRSGLPVDVLPIKAVTDLSAYSAVVIGSPVHFGQWLPEAVQFLEDHRDALSQMPVAYFTVAMTMHEDTAEARAKTMAFLDPVLAALPEIDPVGIGLFAGKMDRKALPRVEQWVATLNGYPDGDFRNEFSIRTWANLIRDDLTPVHAESIAWEWVYDEIALPANL